MKQAEELDEIATWLSEEGLAPDSSQEAQLCLLWRALKHTRSFLSSVTKDLEMHRSQHVGEMEEVRKSLEQIRIFTKHKDLLSQEIQDENDQLREQLQHVLSLQDAQLSEVGKMLYQQGLTELIHSSPSEQVAYLLVERASLLERPEDSDKLMNDQKTEAQSLTTSGCQITHKRAPRHLPSTWKRIFGLHKTQSKNTFIPPEARHLAGHTNNFEEHSRLERDLEEGSRRLAMAHSEIRRLTDELESAHLARKAYEPELQSAELKVEELRQEVEKLKKYEMVELRKAKELNDCLELEIRTLRNRVRTLNAEKNSQAQTVESLQKEVKQLESALQQQLRTVQTGEADQMEFNQLSANKSDILEKNSTIPPDQFVDIYHGNLNNMSQNCTKENNLKDQRSSKANNVDSWASENVPSKSENLFIIDNKKLQTEFSKEATSPSKCSGCQRAMETLFSTQKECESLKEEICETLKHLDDEKSKYHTMKEKHKEKLSQVKHKIDIETTWRDEKIKNLQRELSLCAHSLMKEKEHVVCITFENDKLLSERRKLLQQLIEEEHQNNHSNVTAALSKCRVEFLEAENRKLWNKSLDMSNQILILERSLQNMQSLPSAEEIQQKSNHR